MSKKKRVGIIVVAIMFMIFGFICLTIAAIIQEPTYKQYAHIIGLSSFIFWGLGLFVLVKNYANIVSSEIVDIAKKMNDESDFFSYISDVINPHKLEELFIGFGFKKQQEYLHKRQFSLAKDYINYYVAIVETEDIQDYFESHVKKVEPLFQNQKHLHKNNAVYVFFFVSDPKQEKLEYLKRVIINQEAMQEIPGSFDTILPIVYDTVRQEFIIRTVRRRFSISILDMALRKLYKMLDFTITKIQPPN